MLVGNTSVTRNFYPFLVNQTPIIFLESKFWDLSSDHLGFSFEKSNIGCCSCLF